MIRGLCVEMAVLLSQALRGVVALIVLLADLYGSCLNNIYDLIGW